MDQSSNETSSTIRRRRDKDFRMDHYRYSVMNMQESADVDLDALLKELCALEDQLKNGHLFPGELSSSPPSEIEAMPKGECADRKSHISANNSVISPSTLNDVGVIDFYELSSQKAVHFADSHAVKRCDLPQTAYNRPCTMNDGARSPDNDSAFCDNMSIISVDSSHSHNLKSHQRRPPAIPDFLKLSTVVDNDDDEARNFTTCRQMNETGVNRDSQGLSIDSSTRGSMMTPSPTQLLAAENVGTFRRPPSPTASMLKMGDNEDKEAELKLEKIKIALEKMKEASVKKIYVKIFTWDGNSKSLLIDERLTILDVLKILAEKNHVTLTVNHSLVEYQPDLLMERIYEDNEKLVGNILMWTTNSNNKLYFVERPVKYDIFRQPHSSKDLVCLAQLDSVQIYNGIGWKKKYKAPTEFGFALKHPQIQIKASRYIKYLCAEDDKSHSRWIAALRIAKVLYYCSLQKTMNGKTLYNNYHKNNEHCTHISDDVHQAKSSLKLSSSLESLHSYYKDSVVMRPRLSQASTDADDRPSSAKIVQSCSQNPDDRNSQQKNRTLRSNSVSRTKIETSIRDRKITTIENRFDQKLEIDSGTISNNRKCETVRDLSYQKRPGLNGAPKLPLTEQTRQLHCAATSKSAGAAANDTDITTVLLSSRCGPMPPEPDSDEDDDHSSQALHDLAQSASMIFSTTSTSSSDVRSRSQSESAAPPPTLAELFPPPPSPLPLAVLESNPYSEEMQICDFADQSNNGQTLARLPLCTCPASTVDRHSIDQHQKGPPPAPPKRSENTRLTITAVRASKAQLSNNDDPASCNLRRPTNGFPSMHLQSYRTASEYCDIYANSEPNYSNRAQYFEQSKKLNVYH